MGSYSSILKCGNCGNKNEKGVEKFIGLALHFKHKSRESISKNKDIKVLCYIIYGRIWSESSLSRSYWTSSVRNATLAQIGLLNKTFLETYLPFWCSHYKGSTNLWVWKIHLRCAGIEKNKDVR